MERAEPRLGPPCCVSVHITHTNGALAKTPHFTCFQFPRRQCSTRLAKPVQLQLPHRLRALVGTASSSEPLLTGTAIRHQSHNQNLGSSLRRNLAAMSRQGSNRLRCEPHHYPPAASGVNRQTSGRNCHRKRWLSTQYQAIRSELLWRLLSRGPEAVSAGCSPAHDPA